MAKASTAERDRRRAARDAEKREHAARVDVVVQGADAGAGAMADAPRVDVVKENNRLAALLTPTGALDVKRLRPDNLQRFRRAFADPDVRAAILSDADPADLAVPIGRVDATASAVAPVVEIFTPSQIKEALNVLAHVQTAVVTRVWGVPADVAERVMRFTDEEKDELAPPAARVINKHAPDWLKKYADEITLVTVLGGITLKKIGALNLAMAARSVVVTPASPSRPVASTNGTPTPTANAS